LLPFAAHGLIPLPDPEVVSLPDPEVVPLPDPELVPLPDPEIVPLTWPLAVTPALVPEPLTERVPEPLPLTAPVAPNPLVTPDDIPLLVLALGPSVRPPQAARVRRRNAAPDNGTRHRKERGSIPPIVAPRLAGSSNHLNMPVAWRRAVPGATRPKSSWRLGGLAAFSSG
jgi:hypothetical protein